MRPAVLKLSPIFALCLIACCPSAHAQEREPITKVAPAYPPLARQMHIAGKVKVTATVDPNGTVSKAQSDSPIMLLVPAAIEAVKRWKFKPSDTVSTVVIMISFDPAS
jgi:TonB family protein